MTWMTKASVQLLSILAKYLHEMVYTRVGGWRFRWARICHPCADDRQVINRDCGMVYEIVLLTRLQWCTGAMHIYSSRMVSTTFQQS
jgi:hypothetical protein